MDTSEQLSKKQPTTEASCESEQDALTRIQLDVLENVLNNALLALKPEDPMRVSEWAAKYRYMGANETSRPGPWRNEIVPYLVDIMDSLNKDGIEQITFLKPTQVGGTECGINILGYIISQAPCRVMYVLPNKDALEDFSQDRLQKVLTSNECFHGKFEATNSKNAMLRYAGGFCKFGSAQSPTDLASWSVPVIVLDEIDKFPKMSGKEASPLKLAEERTKNWSGKKKMFFWSTPTLKTGHIYQLYEAADVRYEYNIPCPHCGKMQPFKWKYVKFDAHQPATVVEHDTHYECCYCKGVITDKDKPDMLNKGRWLPTNECEGQPRSVAYALNSLYSPWVSFGKMAAEFIRSKNDPLLLMNFVNSWLGEPWESKSAVMEADIVLKHKTDCPMYVVPYWCQLLTGGVDVQKGYLYWQIDCWGPGITSQRLAYGKCIGWDELEKVMDTIWTGEDGKSQYQVCIYGIDTGFRTEEVYDYCWKHQGVAFPVKGSSVHMAAYLRPTNIEPRMPGRTPLQLWIVNTDQYKNEIAQRLEMPIGRGSWMLNADCDLEYAEQITSEHRVMDDKGRETWKPKTSAKQNHLWDCSVYSFAVADLVNMRALQDVIIDDTPMEADAPEETVLPEPGFTI